MNGSDRNVGGIRRAFCVVIHQKNAWILVDYDAKSASNPPYIFINDYNAYYLIDDTP